MFRHIKNLFTGILLFSTLLLAEEYGCKDSDLLIEGNEDCINYSKASGYEAAFNFKNEEPNLYTNKEIENICSDFIEENEKGRYNNSFYKNYFLNGCANELKYEYSNDSKIKLAFPISIEEMKDKYKVYSNYTIDIDLSNIIDKRELFFGTVDDYKSTNAYTFRTDSIIGNTSKGAIVGLKAGSNAFSKGFTNEGLKHGAAGIGIGLIYGLIDSYYKAYKEIKKEDKLNRKDVAKSNKKYLLVEAIQNNKNEYTKKMTFFVLKNGVSVNKEIINEIMRKGK